MAGFEVTAYGRFWVTAEDLTTVNNERPLKHRCLDCLIFFAERDLKEKPRSYSTASGTA